MPPKRKAEITPSSGPSPRKRQLRNREVPATDSKTLDISSTREISIGSQAPSHTSPTKSARRGRPPKQRGTQTTTEHPPRPNTPHLVRTDSLHLNGASSEQEDLDDELLLLPTVVRSNKPVTPTPGSSQAGTPRYVLDFVEIVTPSKLQRNFPSPSLHTHRPPRPSRTSPTPSRSFPAQPTTSTRRSRKPPSRSPQKVPSGIRLNSLPVQIDNSSGVISPRRAQKNSIPFPHMSPIRQNTSLSGHLRHYLIAQKRATLRKLQKLPVSLEEHANEDGQPQANAVAYAQLSDLLLGTVSRGEGNSCILTGPRGSGKTQLVERAIAELPERPIVIRLSGHAQTNDRLAMREIAWQLMQQTGASLFLSEDQDEQATEDSENPFMDGPAASTTLPPPAHLLALISMIPTLSRPTVIILDAFDFFALHARQSLLYCLFDTVQHSKGGLKGKGMSVVGVTTRVDTVNLLEKRVKSRFSGRIFRTSSPSGLDLWMHLARTGLCASIGFDHSEEWAQTWKSSVDDFLQDPKVFSSLSETFSLSRDVRLLSRILTDLIVELTPSSPFPSWTKLQSATNTQRCPPPFPYLSGLSYPCISLLIAAKHAETSGHDTFTFEMLFETFNVHVRMSLSAPVHVEGGGIGMLRCTRGVMIGAFEQLISLRHFVAAGPISSGTTKEFAKFRCTVDRVSMKQAVDKRGQLNLKKWFTKAS